MRAERPDATNEAEDLYDQGMELWWAGDREEARRVFRKVLRKNPSHVDSLNHLGVDLMERGRLKEAVEYFQRALSAGEPHLERIGERVPWGIIENRPYLRAFLYLALVRSRQRRHSEAVERLEHLLKLNPDDNQGARYVLGEEYHRLGDLERAVHCYRFASDDPGVRYSLALALLGLGRVSESMYELLTAFAGNRYVAPLLLNEEHEELEGYHGPSMAMPEFAVEYVRRMGPLWRKTEGALPNLRAAWRSGPVRAWRARLDHFIVELGRLPPGPKRSATVEDQFRADSPDTIRAVGSEAGLIG